MFDVEWSVDEVADVTLVEVTVHNPTAVDREVRVEDRLDGPTLPPRTDGVPERGWDEDGYAGVVPAGERLRLGYASPSPPVEPPVAVEDEGRVTDARTDAPDAAAAVRALGECSPPADAVPAPLLDAGGTDGSVETDATTGVEATDDRVAESVPRADASPVADATDDADEEATTGGSRGGRTGTGEETTAADDEEARDETAGTGSAPAPVDDWLATVERRVDHAERLTGASVVEAAAVLDERGGLSAVESLPEAVSADERALRAVAERATALADRAAATDVPLPALRRLS